MKQWEVIHPSWGNDSGCGVYDDFEAAKREAQRMTESYNDDLRIWSEVTEHELRTVIYKRTRIDLAFGWRLAKDELVATFVPRLPPPRARKLAELARLLHEVNHEPYKSRRHEDRIRKLRHELGNDELSEWEAQKRAELGDIEYENRMAEAREIQADLEAEREEWENEDQETED